MLYHKRLTKWTTESLQGVCRENFSERLYCFLSHLFEQGLLGTINMKLEPKAKIVAYNSNLNGTKKWCHEYYMIVYPFYYGL